MLITPPPTNNFDVGLQNKNSASERIAISRATQQRVSENNARERNLNSDPQADFGLQDRATSSERISSGRSTQQRVVDNNNYERNLNSDPRADFGLQDRGTTTERVSDVQNLKQRVIENHGFVAKKSTRDALANNTKIINIPVLQRGSLLDIRI